VRVLRGELAFDGKQPIDGKLSRPCGRLVPACCHRAAAAAAAAGGGGAFGVVQASSRGEAGHLTRGAHGFGFSPVN
jgi:hypothetical protein